MTSVHDFSARDLQGRDLALSRYQGKVLLVVNTASQCGFTPQYKGLQKLYEQYQDQGLEILGFPCNQFAHQEPGSADDIGEFCELNYGVSFPLFDKIEVNGDDATWHVDLQLPLVDRTATVETEDVERDEPRYVKFVGRSNVMRVTGEHRIESTETGCRLDNEFVVDGRLPGVESFFERKFGDELDNLERALERDLGLA